MTPLPTQALNPWLSIWIKPRQTIQQIIDTNPQHLVLVLAGLAGIIGSLNLIPSRTSGDISSLIFTIFLVVLGNVIVTIIGLYIYGAAIKWTGNWLNGKANRKEIRAALAWSMVPIIATFSLRIIYITLYSYMLFSSQIHISDSNAHGFGLLAPLKSILDSNVYGYGLFASPIFILESNLVVTIIFKIIGIIQLIAGLWSFFLCMHCLGQVQGFSVWKAMGNTLLASLIIMIPLLIIIIGINFL